MRNSITEAMLFAREKHANQKRKYTNAPYFTHLAEVAGIATTAHYDYQIPLSVVICVSLLHDVIEDQNVTREEIATLFGDLVAEGVMLLSDLETGTRAERKEQSRIRLAAAPGWVQTIKCADLISNTQSIVLHDPKFAVTYLEEKRLLLDVMTRADETLHTIAKELAGAA